MSTYAKVVPAAWLPNPQDEHLHEPTGDPSLPWKDTWYISMRDEESDQTLNMHMTISANRTPPTRVGVSVAQGTRAITEVLRNEGANSRESLGNELGRLDLVHLSGDGDHELRWVGELSQVSFDITVKGQHYASFWDTMFPAYYATGKFGHQYSHYEQVVTGTGWIQWKGGEKVPFSGTGWRDRGWGRRKTEVTFNTGIDLIGGVLPDASVFSAIGLRSNEVAQDAPMPIAGWRSDTDCLVPLTGGLYHKDSMAWPAKLELEFLDGYRFSAVTVRRSASVAAAWHDAEPEVSGIAHNLRDYYAVMEDQDGREFTIFSNHGNIHKVDVFRDAEFKYTLPPES
jgi:hypothetical protein